MLDEVGERLPGAPLHKCAVGLEALVVARRLVQDAAQKPYGLLRAVRFAMRFALVDDRLHAMAHPLQQLEVGDADNRRDTTRCRLRLTQDEIVRFGSVSVTRCHGGLRRAERD